MLLSTFLLAAAVDVSGVEARERLAVALDWSQVSDEVMTRCSLGGLENLLLQALVEAGYALVASAGPDDANLVVRQNDESIIVEATYRSRADRRDVQLPIACDSTIEVDLIHSAKAVLATVAKARPLEIPVPSSQEPNEPPTGAPPLAAAGDEPHAARLTMGVALAAGGRQSVLPALRASGRYGLARSLEVGVAVECSAGRQHGLTIAEPAVGALAAYEVLHRPTVSVSAGLDASLVGHFFWVARGPEGHAWSSRLGIPVEVVVTALPLGLSVMPYVRLTPVRHVVDDHTVFDAGPLGVELCIFVPLSL